MVSLNEYRIVIPLLLAVLILPASVSLYNYQVQKNMTAFKFSKMWTQVWGGLALLGMVLGVFLNYGLPPLLIVGSLVPPAVGMYIHELTGDKKSLDFSKIWLDAAGGIILVYAFGNIVFEGVQKYRGSGGDASAVEMTSMS